MKKVLFLGTVTTTLMLANASSGVIPQSNTHNTVKISYVKSTTSYDFSGTESNVYIYGESAKKQNTNGLIIEAHEVLGTMRDLTLEEENMCRNALYKMSDSTGVSLF